MRNTVQKKENNQKFRTLIPHPASYLVPKRRIYFIAVLMVNCLYLSLPQRFKKVPGTGVEPVRPYQPQDFKSCVSTSSTTQALGDVFVNKIPLMVV
jgi:hypothetical protein